MAGSVTHSLSNHALKRAEASHNGAFTRQHQINQDTNNTPPTTTTTTTTAAVVTTTTTITTATTTILSMRTPPPTLHRTRCRRYAVAELAPWRNGSNASNVSNVSRRPMVLVTSAVLISSGMLLLFSSPLWVLLCRDPIIQQNERNVT